MARGVGLSAVSIVLVYALAAAAAPHGIDAVARQSSARAGLGGACARDFECVGRLVCIDGKCEQSQNWEELSRTAVITIAVGAAAVLVVLIFLGYYWCCRVRGADGDDGADAKVTPSSMGVHSAPALGADAEFVPFRKPASLLDDYKAQSEGGLVKDNSTNNKLDGLVPDNFTSLP